MRVRLQHPHRDLLRGIRRAERGHASATGGVPREPKANSDESQIGCIKNEVSSECLGDEAPHFASACIIPKQDLKTRLRICLQITSVLLDDEIDPVATVEHECIVCQEPLAEHGFIRSWILNEIQKRLTINLSPLPARWRGTPHRHARGR